ncbi:VOC family protein [Pseudomonas sp. SL4(2022)]|uniref:bleomycin resistance protein n=1 Tax=Pseudomonas sp. SL4(2022) TaxID=2994661 RepID=UPI0022721FC6|nr:VOC family protein [Pseudomonas sp. SL4(2022)]WAC43819.1 VOC family protein [Pseudomonas sp. SL4(2022)]
MTYWNPLVPELTVSNVDVSLGFYLAAGFQIRFRRSSPEFVYIELGHAQLMLEEDHPDNWKTADLNPPYGRGVNFQVEVESISTILENFINSGISLFREPTESWYETSPSTEEGQIEFLAQDPDGYLMRFVEILGKRCK